MTDVGEGVYVIRAGDQTWVPDDEVGGLMQVLFEEDDTAVGRWMPGNENTVEGNVLPARLTVVVQRGTVRIVIEDGPTLDLAEGDLASLPQGANVSWYPSHDFVKVWLSS